MSAKNGAAELYPKNLEQYDEVRKAARRNQQAKVSHDAAQKKRKGRSEEQVQEWREKSWRIWNENGLRLLARPFSLPGLRRKRERSVLTSRN